MPRGWDWVGKKNTDGVGWSGWEKTKNEGRGMELIKTYFFLYLFTNRFILARASSISAIEVA